MAMAMPRGSDDAFVAATESYLDQIDTILQQFMDYAGSGEREAPQPGDLNALVQQLSSDFAGLGHSIRPVDSATCRRSTYRLGEPDAAADEPDAERRASTAAPGWPCAPGPMRKPPMWRSCDRGDGIRRASSWSSSRRRSHAATTRAAIRAAPGLGLAIVERIARLHGGSLEFRPRDGGGLEAVVALLLRPAA